MVVCDGAEQCSEVALDLLLLGLKLGDLVAHGGLQVLPVSDDHV